jgi:hypothetical protein
MHIEIFKSDRYFILYDIIVSHGQLLLRSQKTNEFKNNVDVIFFGAVYIQSFARLKGLKIKRLDNDIDKISYKAVKSYLEYENNHLFEIESSGEKYYIAASFVRVFENSLDFEESSLKAMEKGREIASSFI